MRSRSRVAALVVLTILAPTAVAQDPPPVALRAESFTVPPSTRPVTTVLVKNLGQQPYTGKVSLQGPEGWRIGPAQREVTLEVGQTSRVPFTIEQARNVAANAYPVVVTAIGGGTTVERRQQVVCASAPYFKPTIDGKIDEWRDAIPVTFAVGGKKTIASVYWNRRQFSLLVAVEEDELQAYRPGAEGCDAVQVSVAAGDATTPTSADAEAARFEFLLVPTSETEGKCFLLATPGTNLAETAKARSLESLVCGDADVAIRREGKTTWYECGISFRLMRDEIRPSEGREFCMSLLVHDPAGTGLRDYGSTVGLWPQQRNALAWSRWPGAQFGDQPPMDNKIRWGFCTSKY